MTNVCLPTLISRCPRVSWTLTRGWPAFEIRDTSDTSAHLPAPAPHIECKAAPLMLQHWPPLAVLAIYPQGLHTPDIPLNVLTEADGHLSAIMLLTEAGHCERRVISPCLLIIFLIFPISKWQMLDSGWVWWISGAHYHYNPQCSRLPGHGIVCRAYSMLHTLCHASACRHCGPLYLLSLSVQSKHVTPVISSGSTGGDQEERRICYRLLSDCWRR